jgi:hypothetical protein
MEQKLLQQLVAKVKSICENPSMDGDQLITLDLNKAAGCMTNGISARPMTT